MLEVTERLIRKADAAAAKFASIWQLRGERRIKCRIGLVQTH